MEIRRLAEHEIGDLWSIDRSERIESIYVHEGGRLEPRAELHEVIGWPEGERERDEPRLRDCFARGGVFYGAFEDERLLGAAVLDCRFMGRAGDQLQLKFLYVSSQSRNRKIGRTLFEKVVARARAMGARRLYISATPSENTVRFYLRRGCRVTKEVDPALFALEPDDIHLELEISDR